MVSFQCDACCDVVKKPKLDQHRARCNSSFTCIDCSTTFSGPHEYRAHVSCISEAQKYEKGLYKGPKPATENGNSGWQSKPASNWNGGSQGRWGNNSAPLPRYQRPFGTGANYEPLGKDRRMNVTPPNEVVTPVIKPVEPTTSTKANGAPPEETKSERKQRKKAERELRKAAKMERKAQEKAAKAEVARQRAKAKQAASNGVETLAEPAPAENPSADVKEKKKRKRVEEEGESQQQSKKTKVEEDPTAVEKPKKKKKASVEAEPIIPTVVTEEISPKKRKRDEDSTDDKAARKALKKARKLAKLEAPIIAAAA